MGENDYPHHDSMRLAELTAAFWRKSWPEYLTMRQRDAMVWRKRLKELYAIDESKLPVPRWDRSDLPFRRNHRVPNPGNRRFDCFDPALRTRFRALPSIGRQQAPQPR